MFHHEIPLNEQPYPDSREYATSANQLAHGHGYTTPIIDNGATNHWAKTENPPRYSPGYPFALSPFGLLGRFPGNIEFGAKVMVLLMLVSVAWAAVEIAGPIAAVLAVLLVGSGSFTSESAQLVLSDAFAAGLAVAVLALVKRQGPFAAYAAGFLAGYGVLVRVNGFVVVACLLLVLGGRDRTRAIAAAAPSVVALFTYQWVAFGRPWRTGYGYWVPQVKEFALAYVTQHPILADGLFADRLNNASANWACHVISCHGATGAGALPNWLYYILTTSGLTWVFAPPLVPLVGLVVAIQWRREPHARFVLLVTGLTFAFYLPYAFQSARFMAAPVLMLVVLACAGFVGWVKPTRWWRGTNAFFRPLPEGSAGPSHPPPVDSVPSGPFETSVSHPAPTYDYRLGQ